MLIYYNEIHDFNTNITYSIDNIVADFVFSFSSSCEGIQLFLNSLSNKDFCGIDVKYWFSSKFCDFQHNFNITLDDGVSFYCGVAFNGVDHWHRNYCRIDFNPNKVRQYKAFVEIYNNLLLYCKPPTIKRYDFAIDMPLKRENVFLTKNNKKYQEIQTSLSDRTQYLGSRSSVGRCKLYNKQLESNLNTPMTRLEMTLDTTLTFDEVLNHIPKLTIIDDIQLVFEPNDNLSSTDKALIELILRCNGYDVLRTLKYEKRKKIERILNRYVHTMNIPHSIYSAIISELNTYYNSLPIKIYSDVFGSMHIFKEVEFYTEKLYNLHIN